MKHFSFLFIAMVLFASCRPGSRDLTLLVGTYTPDNGHGIYTCRFNPSGAHIEFLDSTASDNPSFLAVSPLTGIVYAVNESGPGSALSSFITDRETGLIHALRRIDNPGADPCHLAVDPAGRYVVTADYSSGTLTFFNTGSHDILGRVRYAGSGPDPARQQAPHIHCVVFSPSGEHLFATDLGTDRIYVLKNVRTGIPVPEQTVVLEPGSGPRHMTFNKSGSRAYLINELSGMVTVFAHREGKLEQIQSLVADTCQARGSAHIALSGDGRFLYASTRLQGDGMVIYSVDRDEGTLTRNGFLATGSHPRHFLITPDDKWVLVSCKNENQIEIYRRNIKTGLLTDTGKRAPVRQPVCIGIL
jgi:6-phosphogluconolactonase (cycloisomerase 2 family)